MSKAGLGFFSVAVMSFFAVSGAEVWRAADAYDSTVVREYYRTRGRSIIVEGIVRVIVLWSAVHIYKLAIGGHQGNPSHESAWVVGAVVAMLVGLEVLMKSLVALGSSLPEEQLVQATDLTLARSRLFVYPVVMAVIAYLVMRFRSVWATGALSLALALTNGVLILGITMFALRLMGVNADMREPHPKLKSDIEKYLDIDVSRVSVDHAADEINASADLFGNVTVNKPIIDRMSHRGLMGVLGHEVGHVKMRHVPTGAALSVFLTVMSAVAAILALRFGTPAARLIGMPDNRVAKTAAGFIMFMTVEPIMRIAVAAIMSTSSVTHEYEADAYSGKTLGPGPMTDGLKTLGDLFGLSKRQPLAHSFPTHPPTRSRLAAIAKLEGKYPNKL